MVNPFPVKKFKDAENLYQQEKCVICFDEFEAEIDVVELACGHIFSPDCTNQIEHCSFCRTPVVATEWLMGANYQQMYQNYIEEDRPGEEEVVGHDLGAAMDPQHWSEEFRARIARFAKITAIFMAVIFLALEFSDPRRGNFYR